MQYLLTNSLLAPQQHGFVSKKACVTNLFETVDIVASELAIGRPVDFVYLDFAEAFDTVLNKRLFVKLEAYGIDDQMCAWVRDFMSDRKQRVVMGEFKSKWTDATSSRPPLRFGLRSASFLALHK